MSQTQPEAVRTPNTVSQADIQRLLDHGRARTFVTLEEIQALVPNPEDATDAIDMIYAALSEADIPVRESEEEDVVSTNLAELDGDLSDALLGDSVRLYLREIGQVQLLTHDQEKRLAQAIVKGQEAEQRLKEAEPGSPEYQQWQRDLELGNEARQQMAAANLRLVVSIAKRYRDRGLPLLDLIQEGSLGLLRAIEKFDHEKGFKFSTYATWWIKQALSRALADQSRLVRLPVHLGETLNRIQAARRQLTQSLGREPNDSELAHHLEMSEEKLRELRRTAQDPVSLATPVGEEADSTLADFIPDPHALDADDAAASGMLRDQITTALDQLTERERRVLELRYGLSDGQPRTLEEVGKAFGVTRERVRQIEVKALRKLRHPRLGKLLKDYLDQI
ncbi:RNA polymerase sigma factor RpoD [Candidatus Viridilinea mediisalina]|uniref:RNA polymerase sigma factor SigA n=1 Tax=Candidatus Viridilinea mediisalina TaxID=2024553 RepID=A0A2A6RID2_9CHLR|nr:RNA polymerase sigma factor RpoD [Candidatus Viridilinea mediisalina]PDW02837.1 RNA polymerase sigma factor RpoD [Candidatus Viridilinea mediisalina]